MLQNVNFASLPSSSGIVCGVQSSISSFFESLSFLAATFLTDPTEFPFLMLASLIVVFTAWMLFIAHTLQHGGDASNVEPKEAVEDVREPLLATEVDDAA